MSPSQGLEIGRKNGPLIFEENKNKGVVGLWSAQQAKHWIILNNLFDQWQGKLNIYLKNISFKDHLDTLHLTNLLILLLIGHHLNYFFEQILPKKNILKICQKKKEKTFDTRVYEKKIPNARTNFYGWRIHSHLISYHYISHDSEVL